MPPTFSAFVLSAGFTRVMIDRGEEVLWQREGCANSRGMLKATQIKAVFARIVREAVSNLGYQRYHSISKDFVLSGKIHVLIVNIIQL